MGNTRKKGKGIIMDGGQTRIKKGVRVGCSPEPHGNRGPHRYIKEKILIF